MRFRVRPATNDDFQAVYEMAKLTGGGFTNHPADRGALVDKLIRSEKAFTSDVDEQRDDMFMMVLENAETGQVRGTCQLFGMVGTDWPFYSYRISTLTQTSKALNKTFRAEQLMLCTDHEGSSEVGGLFLHPGERAGGLGLLLARSRYLFMKQHRRRFGERGHPSPPRRVAEHRWAGNAPGRPPRHARARQPHRHGRLPSRPRRGARPHHRPHRRSLRAQRRRRLRA